MISVPPGGTIKKLLLAALLSVLQFSSALAYDDAAISSLLDQASRNRNLMPPAAARGARAPAPADQAPALQNSIDSINKAFDQLLQQCDGRTGVLRSKLEKQTIRAERISIAGGLIGVIGTIATCPHGAALASGLAGLANPLQQTFRENSDTPEDTREALKQLSETIRSDLEAYRRLPQPISGEKDYEEKLLNRIDALRIANASCRYYDMAARTADESLPKIDGKSGTKP
ncbi:hypothetical protein [Zoogloea sp.]|uniref:hypothetical protein n=1 Tax=Zoogloea sp. TaxID=49181 RepID=UPI001AC21A29|nr:hypothetical protein [Zoogloea sp.]MBN8283185.1 hypothetical protein [Zoogloea sp.]